MSNNKYYLFILYPFLRYKWATLVGVILFVSTYKKKILRDYCEIIYFHVAQISLFYEK